uniref:Uncharacterized protein n=1 Tax=Rhizophora mucronata TaxID=61149 RepID=A0A2P2PAU7_RHIMU
MMFCLLAFVHFFISTCILSIAICFCDFHASL